MNRKIIMHKIAVVGISCIFPNSLNTKEFNRNIMEKRESIIDIPQERWIINAQDVIASDYRPDTACSKKAGIVNGFEFDPSDLLIPSDILLGLDPLQKMVLHTGRDALSQCWSNQEIRKRTGVVLAAIALPTAKSSELAWQIVMEQRRACPPNGMQPFLTINPNLNSIITPNLSIKNSNLDFITALDAVSAKMVSAPAAVLAQAMGLMGGSFTLDAACASSLYAIKIACEKLDSGKVDMMVAGGVSRPDSLYTQIGFTQLRALSPSGKCSPFDKNADGLVVGEGAGIVVLKRLEDAVKCGDHIWGVITGAGWSNDIEGNLVAPASEGQVRAMKDAYKSAGWLPSDVQYIECHGSGTPVGDNVELNSLATLWQDAGLLENYNLVKQNKTGMESQNIKADFHKVGDRVFHKKRDDAQNVCAIGSIKSMIGHLLTAAGIAGFIKTLLAIDSKMLPPSLNFSEPAPDSPLHTTPFYVQTEPQEWKPMPLNSASGRINGNSDRNFALNSDLLRNSKKNNFVSRRAGISAFGFGGINAHILVEEFRKERVQVQVPITLERMDKDSVESVDIKDYQNANSIEEKFIDNKAKSIERKPIAIIGMEVITSAAMNLESFKKQLFRGGISGIGNRTNYDGLSNYDSCYENSNFEKQSIFEEQPIKESNGLWIKNLTTYTGEFHIPPNQIKDLLPQHIIMLKAAMGAIKDAGISPRPEKIAQLDKSQSVKSSNPPQSVIQTEEKTIRSDFGAAIGIEFDYGATNFHLRWKNRQLQIKEADNNCLKKELENRESDKNIYPELTAERTLGALGGIAASRIAREFKIGGPCFTVSAGASSGMKALEIAIESLQRGETNTFLCGCVDMSGDIRQDTLNRTLRNYADFYDESAPFDKNSKGVFPSEGAAAIVLKTLEQAQKDGDRIYAVIKGTGTASGGVVSDKKDSSYTTSLLNALNDAEISISDVGLYQAHGSGDYYEDSIELNSLQNLIIKSQLETNQTKTSENHLAITSTSATFGDTNALSGTLSIIQSALSVYHQIIPNLPKFISPAISLATTKSSENTKLENIKLNNNPFYFPKFPAFWIKEEPRDNKVRENKRRIVVAASLATDGSSSHVVLEEFMIPPDYLAKSKIDKERENPLGIDKTKLIGKISKFRKIAKAGKIAFLYPGSGNHFVGMGRKLGIMFPDILRQMEESGASLNKRVLPDLYYPKRLSYEDGWEQDALNLINSHAHNMIFGQVSFGVFMTRIAQKFGIKPDVCIGHSLGETAGLFSLGVWSDPEDMLKRMEKSDLFTEKLAGGYIAAKKAWGLKESETPQWRVAAINRSKDFVKNIIESRQSENKSGRYDKLYLLVANTPDECVIGGSSDQLEDFIKETGCGAMYLDGVVTVHCPIAKECEQEYLNLHKFKCNPPENIDFYSCYSGKKYTPSTETTAQSILNQALYGFDYTELIENAWNDGVRIFIEMGPGSSCTRAVSKILASKPHLAVSLSASSKDEDEELTLYKALDTLFNSSASIEDAGLLDSNRNVILTNEQAAINEHVEINAHVEMHGGASLQFNIDKKSAPEIFKSGKITADAHVKFLEFSQKNMLALERQFSCLTQIASQLIGVEDFKLSSTLPTEQLVHLFPINNNIGDEIQAKVPLFDRNMCMEFATGLASNVLGDSFKVIDTYPVRVRLPDEPLMLVDRIMDIQGEMLSLKSGKIITQHDVKPDAWYLDGGKAPVSISIEAGQADLFLCSWLGIDHAVKGKRRYRLLDAKVTFHRTLPEPNETIEYHIEIERFLKQGDIYLFFFHYQGFINIRNNTKIKPELLISMRDGCAGFFTLDEVKNSGGIILKKEELEPITKDNIKHYIPQKEVVKFSPVIPVYRENYTDEQVEQLRVGNLEACFGKQFEKILLGKNLRLPGIRVPENNISQESIEEKLTNNKGRMHLIDRVFELDPKGGRFGMGFISAEADIHPDDWFLTCHFVDDMVMPGTLMYECCAHALRIFTQRIGWVTTKDEPFYDIIPTLESDLKCRGPVTQETKKARYEIEIKEIGYKSISADKTGLLITNQLLYGNKEQFIETVEEAYEPYIIADAHMFSDDHRIVLYKNMGMRIVGLSKRYIELFWNRRIEDTLF
ncbi:MAG: hypothetical protein HQK63_01095 [Desulfamplus sp.]|nr:hypothetical protein [Desulfamplus sp.]